MGIISFELLLRLFACEVLFLHFAATNLILLILILSILFLTFENLTFGLRFLNESA